MPHRRLGSLAVIGSIGCGGDAPAVVPAQPDLTGTWSVKIVPASQPYAACISAMTFHADGTCGIGTICTTPVSNEVDTDWDEGLVFTADPTGRINFFGSGLSFCRSYRPVAPRPSYGYAQYSETRYRRTTTLAEQAAAAQGGKAGAAVVYI